MNKLKVLEIQEEIVDISDFFAKLIKEYDIEYRENMTQEAALAELETIRRLALSAGEFTLAFVGEYSAGKTTLINLLTGADMEVGTNTTTEKAAKFKWHNITIVDTPGLGSGLSEHDEITKKWLAEADLLVYVLTPDLFNRHSGKRFVELLDEFKRDHELMLVMNMIDQEGNPIEVYKEELQEILNPRPLEDYFPTFISADYQQKSRSNQYDQEDREYFSNESRYKTFVDTLDHFIFQRREKASLSTPLTRLHVLSRKLGFKNRFDQENVLLDMQISIYERASMDIKSVTSDFMETLNSLALGTAGDIFSALDNPAVDLKLHCENNFDKLGKEVEKAVDDACLRVGDIVQRLKDKSAAVANSEQFERVQERITTQETLKSIFEDFSTPSQNGPGKEYTISKLRETISEIESISGVNAPNAVKDIINAKNVFDLTAKLTSKVDRGLILKVGHTIGHKFKPWEAVKLSSKFAKAVPILNVAAVTWEVVSAIRQKKKLEEQNRQLREFKQDIRRMLEKAAAETFAMFENTVMGPVNALCLEGLALLQDKKVQLLEFSNQSKEMTRELEMKRAKCLNLYQRIYL